MVSESWLLNKIPKRVSITMERLCECGKHNISSQVDYDLKLDISVYYERYCDWGTRFHLYYNRCNWNRNGKEYIGECTGIGYKTIKDALRKLLPVLREHYKSKR